LQLPSWTILKDFNIIYNFDAEFLHQDYRATGAPVNGWWLLALGF
jgi:hypothetical protein